LPPGWLTCGSTNQESRVFLGTPFANTALTERVLGDGRLEPVGALREALEGRRGRVHAVLARERLVGQPERLPLREDLPAKRRERRL
jgi:hypothetical protein